MGKSIEDGLGIRHFTGVKDPIALARFIRAQGGLAVVSHPSRYGYEIPPALVGEIDGIEVWNASNDSRFVPDGKVIASPEARQVVLSGEDGGAGNFIVSNRYLRVGGDRPPRWARRRVMACRWRGLAVAKAVRDHVTPGSVRR